MKTINEIIEAARMHFDNAKADIENASNRIEHIRLTALAQEAANLLTDLENFAASDELSSSQLPTNGSMTAGAAICLPSEASSCSCNH
jgi:hypothetical protein